MGKVCAENWTQHYVSLSSYADVDDRDLHSSDWATAKGQRADLAKEPVVVVETHTKANSVALVISSSINLTKSIIGAGVLCLPAALSTGGVGLGVISLVFTGALSIAGFLAIGFVCDQTGARSYREAWSRTVGISPAVLDFIIFLETFGTCMSYVILILDYVSTSLNMLIGYVATEESRVMLAGVLALTLLLPLCLQRDLHNLRFSSLVGNFTMLYTVLFVIMDSLVQEDFNSFVDAASFFGPHRSGCLAAASVMTSAYAAHCIAPDVYVDLRDRRHPNPFRGFCMVGAISFGISAAIYIMFAVAGFARFGGSVPGNVLVGYDNGVYVLVAWVTMSATLTLSFPLLFKPARDTLVKFLGLPPTSLPDKAGATWWPSSWAVATTILLAVTTTLGSMFSDISSFLAFRGALLGMPICFGLPGLMLLNCPTSSTRATIQTAAAKVLIGFGFAAGGLGVFCASQV